MRTVVLMFFMLSVIVPNAFGAGVRAVRGAVNNNATYDISTEKSVDSETVRSARQLRVQTVAPSSVSVRSATRTSVRSGGISSSQSQQNFAQSARAAKKQSAINIGTKVLEATVNTTMPQECVSAYNGCMDSFCVIPNTSGGRCRCDNRVFNFDKISDKIKQFDRNSEAIATDGSKLLNLGKTADDIYSMADEAEKKVMQEQDEYVSDFFDNSLNKKNKKSATLDMSLLGTSDLFDANSDFDENLEAKYGDSLHKYADGLCVEQMPETCEKYILLLKTAYTNQINGDCKAYENDLRKKSVNSEQSKQQAKSELRAAALERYNEDNKYTFAGCVREIKHCMMKDDNCGPGFKKCVYDPIMLKKASDKTRKKKIKIAGGASIEIATVTYNTIEKMRNTCEPETQSCQKNKDDIWTAFWKNVASDVKTTELDAEKDRLHNCSKEIVQCINDAAKSQGYEEGTEMWDLFTSNFEEFRDNVCKNQIDHCAATNDVLAKDIVDYVRMLLDAKRVDGCTQAVKSCYQANCGEDYGECIGKTYDMFVNMCTIDSIELIQTQCSGKGNIKDYVKRVARGIFAEIDDELAKHCNSAIEAAMAKWCNGKNTCDSEFMDLSKELNVWLSYDLCSSEEDCVPDATYISDAVMSKKWRSRPTFLLDRPDRIYFDSTESEFKYRDSKNDSIPENAEVVLKKLNDAYTRLVDLVENDPTVRKCTHGKDERGFNGASISTEHSATYANLTENIRVTIADGLYNQFASQYYNRISEINEAILSDYSVMASKRAQTKQEKKEMCEQLKDSFIKSTTDIADSNDSLLYSDVYYDVVRDECCIRIHTRTYTSEGEMSENTSEMCNSDLEAKSE